jgi:16S rRNA (adenine1518-N6/adenine1519-N6)-dimethyltransferase
MALGPPRKRFGQHFLVNPGVIDKIVAAIDPRADDRMVEIGPGRGALTGPLLDRLTRLEVIEVDRDLAATLKQTWPAERLAVHLCDALSFDFGALGSNLRVVGNLPYNISTPLLFHLVEHAESIRDMYFMLQREVVERMAAAPATAAYGRLSVMLQYRFDIDALFTVSPGSFAPPPKVESAVVQLVPHALRHGTAANPGHFRRLVAQVFAQRRKMLRKACGDVVPAGAWAALDIDSQARGEDLAVSDFIRLSNYATISTSRGEKL